MREIVHIQAGQCGNQIGAKVSYIHTLLQRYFAMIVLYSVRFLSELIFIWSVDLDWSLLVISDNKCPSFVTRLNSTCAVNI